MSVGPEWAHGAGRGRHSVAFQVSSRLQVTPFTVDKFFSTLPSDFSVTDTPRVLEVVYSTIGLCDGLSWLVSLHEAASRLRPHL
ncbi:hypothetical protein JMJ77_0004700 [Colletotrichum scovillei]|uniref:Uncharacterized protein n=1 Tax=Colletotrichum scovillei TaxID=1209932 RepID=A0A9P7ULV1_9PEZI|nr:hypothetical protein JMJ77_0004700 [Colletotrichum scovillei]KAG7075909.1 hypothetical protein JMJ76_0013183 [Colletotrichum scovillei]KAG7083022.1 hypothetical protein JMJ78_0008473 [Colletotrichum scovillei]